MMADFEYEIGADVILTGRVVGRSEFETGRPSYMVEYERCGKKQREWFMADDLDEDLAVDEVGE